MSAPALPPLYDTLLDRDGVCAVVADIEACAELLGVSLKRGARGHGSDEALSLQEALAQLFSGRALGVQVRYRHQGKQWWDTLLRVGEAYRLVRVEHELR
jgi:hypothetical protein